jgi:hypothetical protein
MTATTTARPTYQVSVTTCVAKLDPLGCDLCRQQRRRHKLNTLGMDMDLEERCTIKKQNKIEIGQQPHPHMSRPVFLVTLFRTQESLTSPLLALTVGIAIFCLMERCHGSE